MTHKFTLAVVCFTAALSFAPRVALAQEQVTRATLRNGLQVVVVHDDLAPVVSTFMNYKAGSDEQSVAGLAHATEHMMFRGSKTLSASQLTDSLAITGGSFNADTQNELTQYFFTVPSQYLDVALHLERSRSTGLLMNQGDWNQERGAITQEVTMDTSRASYRLGQKMLESILAGTPYAKDGLGTVAAFAHRVNHPQLIDYYDTWYHPNNAVFVIVGDVDGRQTVARVRKLFGSWPAAKLPAREPVVLRPFTPSVFHETSSEPYTEVLLDWRMPGFKDRDYAAAKIAVDVMRDKRAPLYGLVAAGKALETRFSLEEFPQASIGHASIEVPTTTKPQDAEAMARSAIAQYAASGVPADLVAAAKRSEVADINAQGTSILFSAFYWSDAVALRGLRSPYDLIGPINAVTKADVDRVLKAYIKNSNAEVGYAVPQNGGVAQNPAAGPAGENVVVPPTKHQPLPPFARAALAQVHVPKQSLHPTETTLPNGLHVIVQPERSAKVVVVSGKIKNDPQVQEPAGQEGVGDLTESLFPYGTTTYDRVAFQGQLGDIGATLDAGTNFDVQVPSSAFDRAVQLLADDELHPRLDAADFAAVKARTIAGLTSAQQSPDHLADVALADALYPVGDPARRFATPASAGNVTLDGVKEWYTNAYRPDLTTIVVGGDVTPAQATATVSKYFGAWQATGPKPNVEPPAAAPNGPGGAVIPKTGAVQSTVQLSETTGLLRSSSDWPTMEVANSILTGGLFASVLYEDLREKTGYVYYVLSNLDAGKTRSTFGLTYGSFPKDIVPAQQLTLADLRKMQTAPVAPIRLLRAKAQLMGQVSLEVDSFDGIAATLLYYAGHGLPLDQNIIDARSELAVTPAQLQAAMAKHIRPDGFVRIITGPGPQ